ncbi:MAG: 16S rRNA (cytosine(1402)-N(4))-methyltransferase RsmH [Chloroflexi bacterium]|nr:16S rRNA (cytosine(1402)-N(4))-methyltransferase RsmH [Chloroflexota bacterium]
MSSELIHLPVLLEATLELLDPQPGESFIDCTVNGGGHSVGILSCTSPTGHLLALDADIEALHRARVRLAAHGPRVTYVHGNFRHLRAIADDSGFPEVDGILIDLGMSSFQLGEATRGFAFGQEGPLDMRYDTASGQSAADFLESATPEAIEQTLRQFGEEPQARRIAQAIASRRQSEPIRTTRDLADLVAATVKWRGRIHPATRTFQALRIAVNDELSALTEALPQAIALLRRGARLAVISFHSLEDRIVKTGFARLAGQAVAPTVLVMAPPPAPPALVRIITKRPIMASDDERTGNPRSRSARLRVAECL